MNVVAARAFTFAIAPLLIAATPCTARMVPHASSFPGAPAAADAPCGLLTPEEIKTVLSVAVLPGKPSESEGAHDCTWKDAKGTDVVYLNIKEAKEWKSFRDSMQATGKLTPVTGVAEDAFFVASTGTSAAFYTLKKGHVVLLTVDGPGYSKADNEGAEKTLATRILSRL